jgi:DnaK suppressor protein
MGTKIDLPSARQTLEDERARLAERIASQKAQLGQKQGATPDPGDLALSATSQARRSVLLAQTQQQFDQIEQALRRLNAGTYGQCTICGRAIDAERLAVLPYATTCIRCQRQQERTGGTQRP